VVALSYYLLLVYEQKVTLNLAAKQSVTCSDTLYQVNAIHFSVEQLITSYRCKQSAFSHRKVENFCMQCQG